MKKLGIDKLSKAEQIELALEIWESLEDARPKGEMSLVKRNELSRRDAELDANPGMALTWEQVRAYVEATT